MGILPMGRSNNPWLIILQIVPLKSMASHENNSKLLKRLHGGEYTGESRLPCGECTGGSRLPGSASLTANTPGRQIFDSPLMNTPDSRF